jgi:hypothetical protein
VNCVPLEQFSWCTVPKDCDDDFALCNKRFDRLEGLFLVYKEKVENVTQARCPSHALKESVVVAEDTGCAAHHGSCISGHIRNLS